MLSGPYYPDYSPISDRLKGILNRYYDFLVRYEELLSPCNDADQLEISLSEFSYSTNRGPDSVWINSHKMKKYRIINLINLLNVNPFWQDSKETSPTILGDFDVNLTVSDDLEPKRVFLASPDFKMGRLQTIDHDLSGNELKINVPELRYWDLLLIDPGGDR